MNEKRIERARSVAGINEETNTWNGWKQLGYEVVHGRTINETQKNMTEVKYKLEHGIFVEEKKILNCDKKKVT